MARTRPSQGRDTGSIPVRAINFYEKFYLVSDINSLFDPIVIYGKKSCNFQRGV